VRCNQEIVYEFQDICRKEIYKIKHQTKLWERLFQKSRVGLSHFTRRYTRHKTIEYFRKKWPLINQEKFPILRSRRLYHLSLASRKSNTINTSTIWDITLHPHHLPQLRLCPSFKPLKTFGMQKMIFQVKKVTIIQMCIFKTLINGTKQ